MKCWYEIPRKYKLEPLTSINYNPWQNIQMNVNKSNKIGQEQKILITVSA